MACAFLPSLPSLSNHTPHHTMLKVASGLVGAAGALAVGLTAREEARDRFNRRIEYMRDAGGLPDDCSVSRIYARCQLYSSRYTDHIFSADWVEDLVRVCDIPMYSRWEKLFTGPIGELAGECTDVFRGMMLCEVYAARERGKPSHKDDLVLNYGGRDSWTSHALGVVRRHDTK